MPETQRSVSDLEDCMGSTDYAKLLITDMNKTNLYTRQSIDFLYIIFYENNYYKDFTFSNATFFVSSFIQSSLYMLFLNACLM